MYDYDLEIKGCMHSESLDRFIHAVMVNLLVGRFPLTQQPGRKTELYTIMKQTLAITWPKDEQDEPFKRAGTTLSLVADSADLSKLQKAPTWVSAGPGKTSAWLGPSNGGDAKQGSVTFRLKSQPKAPGALGLRRRGAEPSLTGMANRFDALRVADE